MDDSSCAAQSDSQKGSGVSQLGLAYRPEQVRKSGSTGMAAPQAYELDDADKTPNAPKSS